MPLYELNCPQCSREYEALLKISEYESHDLHCLDCSVKLQRHFRTPTATHIPHHMQAAPNMNKREDARVPINIVDKYPDGTCKVTRIGNKKDIENE